MGAIDVGLRIHYILVEGAKVLRLCRHEAQFADGDRVQDGVDFAQSTLFLVRI